MNRKKLYSSIFFLAGFFCCKFSFSQLVVNNTNPNNNPTYLVQNILMGAGVTATNVTFLGNVNRQIGFFKNGNTNLGFPNILLDSGIVLSTGRVMNAAGPNNSANETTGNGGIGDADLTSLSGTSTLDRAILEFDFVPIGDSVEFQYVFASDEYPEYVNQINDVFGFFISGPGITGPYSNNSQNIAIIPGTSMAVAINNVNNGLTNNGPCTNCAYYKANGTGSSPAQNPNVEYDGFTTVLTAKAIVQCGKTYHIKIAIADAVDDIFDSGVFLMAQSFTSAGIQVSLNTVLGDNNMNEGCADAFINFTRADTDSVQVVHYDITGTAQNGVDYVQIPDSIVFAVGQDSAQITVTLLEDIMPEGVETIVITVMNIIPCTGDTVYETATLSINEGYDLTMSSVNDTVTCALDPLVISSTAGNGSPPYSYTWDNGMTGTPITVNPVVTDSFIVTASDLIGCKGVDTVIVTVEHPLPVVSAGTNKAICKGTSVVIGGSPTGPAGSTYIWSSASSLNNSIIANPTATPSSTTSYIVTVTDVNTCKNRDTVLVTVYNLPVVKAGNDTSICPGISLQIGGSPTGPAGSTFSWSPSATLSSSTASNPVATPVINTAYVVTVTDTNSCVNKDTINVSLFAQPVASASNDTAICAGDTIPLFSSGGVSYIWNPSSGLSSAIVSNPNSFPSTSINYIVTVTDNNNCSDTESVFITVYPLPAADAGNNTSICIGDTVQIGGSPTGPAGSGYIWSPNTTIDNKTIANPAVFPSSSITYYLTVTDVNTCVKNDSIQITVNSLPLVDAGNDTSICTGNSAQIGGSPTGSPGTTISWSPAGSLNNASAQNPTATPLVSTDYIVSVTDGNACLNTDTMTLTLFTVVIAVASNDTSICPGDTAQLSSSGGLNYSWSPAGGLSASNISNPAAFPSSTTTFIVTVSDINNCIDTESVAVTIFAPPAVDAGTDKSICYGDTVQIGGSPSGPAGSTFLWSPNQSISSTIAGNPEVFPLSSTTYYLSITDLNTCENRDSVVVTVNNLPIVNAGNDTSICTGNSTTLGGSPTSATGISYSWTPPATLNDPLLANPSATPVSNTTYIVSVTDGNGCANTDTVDISLFALPVAVASNDTAICINDTAMLIASGGIVYSWGPAGGLDNVVNDTVNASPPASTVYTVTVTDVNGCADTENITLTVFNLPVVDAGADTAICIGDTLQIGGSPTSATGLSYSWSPVSDISDASAANPDVFPNANVIYSVTVTDGNTCANSDSLSITINSLPLVDAGSDTTICDGVFVVIGGNPTGPLNSFFNWSPATSLSSIIVSNPSASPSANITYTVTVTDTNGCVDTDDISFVVNSNPVADAGPDGTICTGDSLQLSGNGGVVYEWIPSDSLSNPAVFDPYAFPADTATYALVVTDVNNCTDTDYVTVNVNQLPPADAGPDLWICPNDSITITGSGGVNYSWSPSTGLSSSTISNPMASPGDTTEYFVTVTDANGCVNIDSMILDVGPTVPTDAGPDKIICIYDTVQIGGSPTSPAGSTFSWNTSGGLSDSAASNPFAYPNDTVTFYVISTNFTCTGTDSVTIIVNPLPSTDAGPDIAICIFDTAQLNASGGTSFVWSPTDSLSDDSIANPFSYPTDTIKYYVTSTDIYGCVNIDSVTVTVNPLPVIIISNDVEICIGDSTQLNASGGTIYSWLPADSLSDDSISNPSAYPSDTTNYVVTVTDGNSCVNKDSVVVTVNPLPLVTVSSDVAICSGDTTTLNASGGIVFSWLPSDSLSDDSIANPSAFPSDTTTYVLTVVDSNSCVNKDSITVTVNPLPNVYAGADVAICIYDSVQLNASGGSTYVWFPADSLSNDSIFNPIAFPVDTTEYIVNSTDTNGCINTDSVIVIVNSLPVISTSGNTEICIGDSTQLNASGGTNFVWLPADSLTDDSIFNPLAFPSDTTNFVVTVTDGNGCVNKDSLTVTVSPLPVVSITGNFEICFGDTTQITASGGNIYSWSPAAGLSDASIENPFAFPSDTQTYVVTVSDSNACVNYDTATIIVNPLPVVDAGLANEICIYDSAQLFASGAFSYVWTPADSLSNDSIFNPVAFPSSTSMYYVTGTDTNSCSGIDSVQILVNPLPTVTISPDTNICIGDSTQIFAAGGSSYVWSPVDSLSNSLVFNPFAFPSSTTIYTVNITDTNGCSKQDSVLITVNPLPVITILGDSIICLNDTTQLTAAGGTVYSWSPDISISDTGIANPQFYPSDTTLYVVEVTDVNSCVNKDSVLITVNPLPLVDAGLSQAICIFDTVQLFANGASTYVWVPSDSLSNDSIQNPFAFPAVSTWYFVTGNDNNTCKKTDSVLMVVYQLPIIVTSADTEICIGDSVQISASGGFVYSWTPSAGLSDDSISNPIAFPADTTVFVVIVTDTNNCVNRDSIQVDVNSLPSNIMGNDIEICIGDSVQLAASGGIFYSWIPSDSLSDDSINNPFAYPTDTTMYIVSVIDTNGCKNADSIIVEVNPLPVIDAGLEDTICFGDTTQLTASGAMNYLWNSTASLNNINVDNPDAFPQATEWFYVTGTDSNNCSSRDSVRIIVYALPVIGKSSDTSICYGDSVALFASGGQQYSWFPSDSLSDDSIPNPFANPSDTTTYIVTVVDSNTCVNRDSILITVNPLPANILGNDLEICSGDSVQLNASGGIFYTWSPPDSLTDDSISNPFAFPSDTITYIVTVSDGNGCVNSDTITIDVNPLPIVDAGLDDTICFKDSVQLVASGGISYTWQPGTGLNNQNIDDPRASPANSTLYVVLVTDTNSCSSTDTVLITVNPLPPADAGADRVACFGDSVQLSASGGENYLWSPSLGLSNINIFNPVATILGTIEYFVQVTDSNNCLETDSITVSMFSSPAIDAGTDDTLCLGDVIQLIASGGASYTWSPGTGLSNISVPDPFANPTVTTEFFVSSTDTNGCSGIDSVMVIVNQLPLVEAGNDTALCINDTIQLSASGASVYYWTPATYLSDNNISDPLAFPPLSNTYFVNGTDTNQCQNSDSINIQVNPLPMAEAGNDTSGCIGTGLQLNASGGTIYSWYPATGLNNPNISNPIATPFSDSIKYYVTVRDNNLCKNSDSVIVRAFSIFIIPDTSICSGDSASLYVIANAGYLPYNYSWSPSGGLNNEFIYNPKASPGTSSTYYVIVTEAGGCSDSSEVTVTVNENPFADFSFTLEASCTGAVGLFDNKSSNADTYVWLFGDNQTSARENPEHLFLYNQVMNVTLIAKDKSGCDDSSTVSQNIQSFDTYYDIVVPDIFTPDGDGINDLFEIRYNNKLQECTDLKIYSRWGEMIFSSSGNQHSWNGMNFSGIEAPQGTYFFIFDINGKQTKGSLTLIR